MNLSSGAGQAGWEQIEMENMLGAEPDRDEQGFERVTRVR